MLCTSCGFTMPAQSGYCANCGTPADRHPDPVAQRGYGPPAHPPMMAPAPQYAPAPNGGPVQQYAWAASVGPPPPHQAAALPSMPHPGGFAPPQSGFHPQYPGQSSPLIPGRYPGMPAGPATDHGPGTAMHWMLPVGRSWQSIVAGYLALLSIVLWPLGPFAVGLGIWALVRAAREKAHGTGRAVFAVIVGLLATFLLLVFSLSR